MNNYNMLTISFLAVLIGLTLLAIRMWYKQRGANVSEAERKVFTRFVLGVAVFWLVAIGAYFVGPLLSGVK